MIKTTRISADMASRGKGHNTRWTATAGAAEGRGTNQSEALADLAVQVTTALKRAEDPHPSFWRDDDNGGIWVSVPDLINGGSRVYRVTDDNRATQIGHYDSSARSSLADSGGLTRILRDGQE